MCGAMLLISGVAHLHQARSVYQNYRGGWVYAPFAIVAGLLAIIGGIRGKRYGAKDQPTVKL
jgi:uncharacterized membrane protein